ncbi:hypothetical protein [Azospirillum aestuarii]|uniref:hypothetical protein n=1 Tax=Azospirillum aestuarii TaxID=2802052 RepID=UPI004054CA46
MNIHLPAGRWTVATSVPLIVETLRCRAFEVDDTRFGYRVLMFRKATRQWTQVHTGMPHRAKAERSALRVSGPETGDIEDLKWAFNEGGIFFDREPQD